LAKNNEQETTKLCNETHKEQCLCKQGDQHPWEQNTDVLGGAHQNFQRNIKTIWWTKILHDGEDRIILITEEPEMGKLMLLTHLAKQTRERRPDVWIVRGQYQQLNKYI
jgi:hypothetical protein